MSVSFNCTSTFNTISPILYKSVFALGTIIPCHMCLFIMDKHVIVTPRALYKILKFYMDVTNDKYSTNVIK